MLVCVDCDRVQSRDEAKFCELCGGGKLQNRDKPEEVELFDATDLPLTLDPLKPQYKVVSQKDRFFSQKFDPARIERLLNEYAQEGWTLKSAVSADIPGIGGGRNELVLFLEKVPQNG